MSDQVPWGAPLPPPPLNGRPFYKKKRYIIPTALLALFIGIASASNSSQNSGKVTAAPSPGVAISTVGPTTAPTVDPNVAAAQASQQAAVEASA